MVHVNTHGCKLKLVGGEKIKKNSFGGEQIKKYLRELMNIFGGEKKIFVNRVWSQ